MIRQKLLFSRFFEKTVKEKKSELLGDPRKFIRKNLLKEINLIQSIDFLHSHSCSAHEAQLHSKP